MPVKVTCSCGRSLNLADNLQGKRVKCPECESAISVPVVDRGSSEPRPGKARQMPGTPSSSPTKPASGARQPGESGQRPKSPRPKPKPNPKEEEQDTDWLAESAEPSWNQTALPPRKNPRSTGRGTPANVRRKFPWLPLLLVGGIGVIVAGVAGVGALILFVGRTRSTVTADVSIPDVANMKVAANIFPPRPDFSPAFPSGVQLAHTRLTGSGPGESTQMNVYLPGGEHADRALGCVLVAPAGTNLLIGNSLDGGDYHDETLPYAEAGFMTIQYSLDGPVANMETVSDAQMSVAYGKFKAAGAGTLNTRSVIEFVKTRFPEVDPTRIYTAGHSSAGTVSLLAAEYLPDVAACIAYAPCSDTEAFHAGISGTWGIDRLLPGLREFDRQFSPIANVQKLTCPVFVFQARDDSVVEVAETKRFADQARAHNQQVEYVEVASGEHYDSMISQGIPRAVAWLKIIDSQKQSKP